MKVVIMAGGLGTRLSEETGLKPKPMVEIGGRPILWHIMTHYSHYGFNDFVIGLGYKGEAVKSYMVDYCTRSGNLTVNFQTGEIFRDGGEQPDWIVELVETGIATMTGGRLKRLAPYLTGGTFMMTWGDGVADVDLHDLLAFHRAHGQLATVTAVHPPARFGHLELDGDRVDVFTEKSQSKEGWINGGFFVIEPEALDYIEGDETPWEVVLEQLSRHGRVKAYRHHSFWQCMDTLSEKQLLEQLWQNDKAPWKTWNQSDAHLGNGSSRLHRNGHGPAAQRRRA